MTTTIPAGDTATAPYRRTVHQLLDAEVDDAGADAHDRVRHMPMSSARRRAYSRALWEALSERMRQDAPGGAV